MFEKAARAKVRFYYKGSLSAEDLWDLPLKDLDEIYKDLNADLKESQEESLLEEQSRDDEILQLKVEIVKHVVKTRLAEKKEHEEVALKAAKKQKLLGVIARKQDEELLEMSVEELTKLVNEM